MRIVVTRPQPDADELAERLAADGHVAIVAPLMVIETVKTALHLTPGLQAIVVSSRHAVWSLAASPGADALKRVPMIAVGAATAASATAAGWHSVVAASGTAAALAQEIKTSCKPELGTILYARGADISLDLVAVLTHAGFSVTEPIVYAARPVSALPSALVDALSAKAIGNRADAIILLSARAAAVYAGLCVSAGHQLAAARIASYCLSGAVSQQLTDLAPLIVRVPEKPDLEHILALINRDAAQFSLERTSR
jgi:uroporphyrinogen-III synthase